MAKGFLLTHVLNGKVEVLSQKALVQDIQRDKKRYKTDPRYRIGELQIRTIEGFKFKKEL